MGIKTIKIISHDLKEIDLNQKIGRYFAGSKLNEIIFKDELWFSNAKNFKDKNERSLPMDILFKHAKAKDIAREISKYQKSQEQSYITCWTKFSTENYALWKLYVKDNDGVCLVTTVGKLMSQLPENVLIGEVVYVGGERQIEDRDIPFIEMSTACNYIGVDFLKIGPYAYEEEIRAVFFDKKNVDGIVLPFNWKEAVDEIYVSPFANKEKSEGVRKLLSEKFDMSIIKESIIDEWDGK